MCQVCRVARGYRFQLDHFFFATLDYFSISLILFFIFIFSYFLILIVFYFYFFLILFLSLSEYFYRFFIYLLNLILSVSTSSLHLDIRMLSVTRDEDFTRTKDMRTKETRCFPNRPIPWKGIVTTIVFNR